MFPLMYGFRHLRNKTDNVNAVNVGAMYMECCGADITVEVLFY
jgi:hypothetical protein